MSFINALARGMGFKKDSNDEETRRAAEEYDRKKAQERQQTAPPATSAPASSPAPRAYGDRGGAVLKEMEKAGYKRGGRVGLRKAARC